MYGVVMGLRWWVVLSILTQVRLCDSIRDMNIEIAHHTTGTSIVHKAGCPECISGAFVIVQPLGERKCRNSVIEEYERNGASFYGVGWCDCTDDLPW